MKKKNFPARVLLYLEYEVPTFIKVKAHTRFQNGKVVKVRSYYRRVEGRLVVTDG